MTEWWQSMEHRAKRIYSQAGEEGILAFIFRHVGTTDRFFVDVGAGDAEVYSNTRLLQDFGWQGVLFDCRPSDHAHCVRLTQENAEQVLKDHVVPREFDLLSLDIDGIDWYVLKAMLEAGFRPRVIVAEFNGAKPAEPPITVAYDPEFWHDGTDYYCASLGAFRVLGAAYGYVLVHQVAALNCFLVRADLLPAGASATVSHHPCQGHEPDPKGRLWVEATP